METIEINKENLLKALNKGSESVKEVILALFPELSGETAQKPDNRHVTERIKTVQDALGELGEEHPLVAQYKAVTSSFCHHKDTAQIIAYVSLQVVCAALNEGWEPQFTEDECRWYLWFRFYIQAEIDRMDEKERQDSRMMSTGDYQTDYAGFACVYSRYTPSTTIASLGSRLCFKNGYLAAYCGKQFINLWADFYLVRK